MRRIACSVGAAGLLLTVGCGHTVPTRQSVAAAKCYLPVSQRLGLGEDQRMTTSEVSVENLGGGSFRVTGLATFRKAGTRTTKLYTCVVVPDSSDRLRGFRVTSIELDR